MGRIAHSGAAYTDKISIALCNACDLSECNNRSLACTAHQKETRDAQKVRKMTKRHIRLYGPLNVDSLKYDMECMPEMIELAVMQLEMSEEIKQNDEGQLTIIDHRKKRGTR